MIANQIAGLLTGGVVASLTDYESIATTTLTGNQATVTFSSIPSGYKHLQIRSLARTYDAATDANASLRFNNDSGSNYWWHLLYGNGSSALSAQPNALVTSLPAHPVRVTGASSSASIFGVGVCDILDYADTNKNKTVRTLTGHDQNGSGIVILTSGLWSNTGAITSIEISGNFVQYSSFALYGIK
jgi:hypothetical protein